MSKKMEGRREMRKKMEGRREMRKKMDGRREMRKKMEGRIEMKKKLTRERRNIEKEVNRELCEEEYEEPCRKDS